MCLVRAALQLILVSCLVAFPVRCLEIFHGSGFAPFKYEIRDEVEDKFLCFGAYLASEALLVAADCLNGIDYTRVKAIVEIKGKSGDAFGDIRISHNIAVIHPIENSTFVVATINRFVANISEQVTRTTPLCENAQLCEIVYSCSNCTDIDYSNSFFDFSKDRDALLDAIENSLPSYLALQGNYVTQSAQEDNSQVNKRLYYHERLSILYANYIVHLKNSNGTFLCAGALIADKFVVTAAECVNGIDYTKVDVVAGTETVHEDDEETLFGTLYFVGTKNKIIKVTIHPEYNVETKNSNIAVLKLEKPYRTGDPGMFPIGRISLCKEPLKVKNYVKVSGWRHMSENPTMSLYSTIVPVVSKEKDYNTFSVIPRRNDLDDQFSVSDLGGPAILNGLLYGIAFSCSNCEGIKYSNSFIELYHFREFIMNAMRPESCVVLKRHSAIQNTGDKSQASEPQNGVANIYSTIKIKDAPYLVQIRDDSGKFLCAGALISKDSVLTASVCFHNIHYTKVVVVAGAETLTDDGVQRKIVSVTIPNSTGIDEDCEQFALLKLKEPVISADSGNENIAIVPLIKNFGNEKNYVHVMGWRHMSTNKQEENKLTTTSIHIKPRERCTTDYPAEYNTYVLCVVGNSYDNQYCVSDLGGPVLCGGELCGIVASCSKCGEIDYANRVIRVLRFESYIKEALVGDI